MNKNYSIKATFMGSQKDNKKKINSAPLFILVDMNLVPIMVTRLIRVAYNLQRHNKKGFCCLNGSEISLKKAT